MSPSPPSDPPPAAPPYDLPGGERRADQPKDEPPSTDDLMQVAVAPSRFVDAVRAALEAGAAHRPPHHEVLRALERRLDAPTSTGLPDPLAPAVLALARTLYGESRAPWEEATAALRRRYLQGSGVGPLADAREADAAVLRWRALLGLVHEDPGFFCDWCKDQPPRLRGRHSFFQGPHRAAALVYAAAGVELQRDDSRPPVGDYPIVPRIGMLLTAAKAVEASVGDRGVDDHTAGVIWNGLFEPRLAASKRMLSALAQQFLAFLLMRISVLGADPAQTYEISADALAEWAQVDPRPVYAAFTGPDTDGSLARELRGRRAVLPDWRWAGLADADPLVLPWFDAPPRGRQHDDHPWLEVTIDRELWPYLRRLCLYLDRLPLVPAGEN